jgi:RimJ/RimL family protein N-acetyltransferase
MLDRRSDAAMEETPTLYTERLILRPLQLVDAEAIQQQFAHWQVVRYLNAAVPWPYPEDGALSYLRDIALPAIARGEEWHWTIRLQSAPEQLLGNISLMDQADNQRGFWLAPAAQGQGLMTEACAAVTRYWFETLGRPLMRVPKAAPNIGSRRISERTGMRLIGTDEDDFVGGRFPRELWEITREEWLLQQS